jgi:hypothetical protein
MKYTYEQMSKFYDVYDNVNFGNRDMFCNKLKEYDVSEEESELIWQSFDVAVEKTYKYIRSV